MLRTLSADERVNSAVVHTGFNLLGLATVLVLYFNYVMVAEFMTPVFLAAVLTVLLRGLRDALTSLPVVDVVKQAESQRTPATTIGDQLHADESAHAVSMLLAPVRVPLRKVRILWRALFAPLVASRRRQLLALAVVACWLATLVWSLNHSPWLFLLACAPVVLAFFTMLCVVLVPVNTLVALGLVFAFAIAASCVGVAFATSVVVESAEFSYALAARVHETLGDEAKMPQFLMPWLNALDPKGSWATTAAAGGTAAAAAAAAVPDWAPSGMGRLVHVAQALYTSRKLLLQSNDTRGFQRAVKTLQGILNLDDELYRTILNVDTSQLVPHPLDTLGKLIVNSGVVLRALLNALSQFGSQLTMTALSLSLSFFNYTFSAMIFLAALFYLLQSETLFLDRLLDFTSHKHAYKRVIVAYLRGIFLASFWSFVLNAVCTGVAFWLFGGVTSFFYTSVLLAGLCGVFPVVPVWAVFLIPATHHFVVGELVAATWLMLLGFAITWGLGPLIYRLVPYSHPYVTGMSFFLGIYSFGLEGIVIGPLLVAISLILWSIFTERDIDGGGGAPANEKPHNV